MEAFPDHPIWSHQVFRHSAYRAFTEKVNSCLHEDATPSISARILEALPDLVDNLRSISGQLIHQSRAHQHETTQIKSKVHEMTLMAEKTQETLQAMTSGSLTFQLKMTPAVRADIALSSSSPSPPPTVSLASIGLQQLEQQQQQQPPPPQHQIDLSDPSRPPLYRMRRDIRTVEQLYLEWTAGSLGCPAIAELDRRYGSRWRQGRRDELQFYSLRREIIKEIDRITHSERVSETTAMQRVQGRQAREKLSLDKLCKTLRREAKMRYK